MAQVVTKLVVDSQEYDNKIKRAAEGLQHYADACKKAGGTLEFVDDEALAFARDLGKMESVAVSAKAKMRELTDAITGATSVYRQMSDVERQGSFGQALAASIDELKTKAAMLKDVMADTNIELKNLASDTNFTEGLNMLTRTIGSCAAAITAWTGDSKEMEVVIKDLAKIGATVAAVDSLTKAFQKQNLVLLKNPYVAATAGAVSLGVALTKLYQKLNEVSAAEKAVEEVQQQGRDNAAKEITRIQTLSNILHDNTRSLDERKTALQEIQALVPNYHGALTTEGTLINDNKDALTGYVAELQRAATAQAAFDRMVEINKQKLAKQVELKGAQQNYAQKSSTYQEYQNSPMLTGTSSAGVTFDSSVGSKLAQDAVIAKKAVDDIQSAIDNYDEELQELEKLINASSLGGKTGGATTGGGKTKSGGSGFKLNNYLDMPMAGSLADLERQASIVQASMGYATNNEEYAEMEAHLQTIIDKMNEIKGVNEQTFTPGSLNDLNNQLKLAQEELANMSPEAEGWADALENVRQKMAAVAALQGQINGTSDAGVKNVKDTAAAWQNAVAAVNNVGSALQQIEEPAAKVSGIVMQAVANIALGFAQAAASPATGAAGVFGWIAAATAGVATMASTIAAIKSATAGNYASGGVVPGNSYSGDNLIAHVNSGETILSAAQSDRVASMLTANPFGNLQLSTKLTGTELLILLNNTNRSLGGSRSFYSERH